MTAKNREICRDREIAPTTDDEICRDREIVPTTDDEICRDREIAPTTDDEICRDQMTTDEKYVAIGRSLLQQFLRRNSDDEICRDREIAPTTGCSFHFKFASPIRVIFGLRNESFSHRIFVAIPYNFI